MFGLTHLELVESLAGAFYCYSLGFATKNWLADNIAAPATPSVVYLAQLVGVLCFGFRLNLHAVRVNGAKEMFGVDMSWYVALVWGMCAYLNWKNVDLLTDAGKSNVYVCGVFAAFFGADALGLIKLKRD
jgi:hypothetical protein